MILCMRKALLQSFPLNANHMIFSIQTRSSVLHIAPDQPRPKDNMFFLLFQLFQSTKIPNMDNNFRTSWISVDVVWVSVSQVELLTTFHSLSTDDTASESVLCSVTFKISVCLCVCVCDTSETWVARKHFITAILFTCTHFFLSNTHPHIQPTFPSYASVLFTQWHKYTIVYVSIMFLIIITQSRFITVNIYFLSHDRNLIKTSWNNLEAAANTHTHTQVTP